MNNSKLTISVIIPTFNEEKNIEKCLKSILDQSYPKFEVIVVDDGSTDKTVEIINKFEVKLLKQKHQGPGKARNLGVKESNAEILVFIDADMTFDRDFLQDLVKPINAEIYKGTFSKEEYISNWDNVWSRCWNFNQDWPKQKMIPDDYPDEGIDFRAVLKSEFENVKGFSDQGYTDTWSLAEKLGYKPHSVKGAKYYHSNPDNLKEVFIQSKWSAKRSYKFGLLGKIITLFKTSLPVSLLIGIIKSIKYMEPGFLFFKLTYDLGAFFGIIEMLVFKKLTK